MSSPGEWIARYAQAWRDKDAKAVTKLFTEDAIYRSSPTAAAHVGSTAIATYWRSATAGQSELDLRFGTPVVAGNRVAVEWWATMRDPGWSPDSPTDEATLPGCLVLIFAPDGRCAELREYYSPLFGRTLPAPVGWGR
jgi:uncharacterized protein (TIGR02246 family)